MKQSIRFCALAAGCAFLFILSGTVLAQSGGARINGVLAVEDGTAPTELAVVLTPLASSGVKTTVTPNKKGRFTIARLEKGTYKLSIEPSGYSISHFKLKARSPSGQPYGEPIDEDLEPGAAPPAFSVIDLMRVSLDLTISKIDISAVGGGISIEQAKDDSPKLAELNEYLNAQDWDNLILRSQELLAEDPTLGGAQYMLAVGHWQAGNLSDADLAMSGALELSPDQPGIHRTYGDLLTKRGQAMQAAGEPGVEEVFVRAVEHLDMQLADEPLDMACLINKIILLDAMHKADETIDVLDVMLELDPENMRAYLHKAELLTELGRAEEALAVIDAMPVNDKAAADVLYNIAVDIYDTGQNVQAVTAVEKAIGVDPDQPLFWRLKGRALIALGKDTEGLVALRHYISMVPEDDPAAEPDRALVQALGGGS